MQFLKSITDIDVQNQIFETEGKIRNIETLTKNELERKGIVAKNDGDIQAYLSLSTEAQQEMLDIAKVGQEIDANVILNTKLGNNVKSNFKNGNSYVEFNPTSSESLEKAKALINEQNSLNFFEKAMNKYFEDFSQVEDIAQVQALNEEIDDVDGLQNQLNLGQENIVREQIDNIDVDKNSKKSFNKISDYAFDEDGNDVSFENQLNHIDNIRNDEYLKIDGKNSNLTFAGLKSKPLIVSGGTIRWLKQSHHQLANTQIINLVEEIKNPSIAVDSRDSKGKDSKAILTSIKNKHDEYIVAYVRDSGNAENVVVSSYSRKDLQKYMNQLKNQHKETGGKFYVNKNTNNFLNEHGLQLPQHSKVVGKQMLTPQDNDVKLEFENPNDAEQYIKDNNLEEKQWQDKVNKSMTMDEAKEMIQRAFNLNNIYNWYDGQYKNADEWLESVGVDEVESYIENTYQLQDKYINKNDDILDEIYRISDVLDSYLKGTLTGKQQRQVKSANFNLNNSNYFKDDRFYAPKDIKVTQELYDKASQRVTNDNRNEVYEARANFIIATHNSNASEILGIDQKTINSKLKQWSNYNKSTLDLSNRLNQNVSQENRWSGLENSSIVNSISITNEEMEKMVKKVNGNGEEWKKQYITSTMLAIDTHTDFSLLTINFGQSKEINQNEKGSTRGMYRPTSDTIDIGNGYLNTISHEIGHYIDHLWGRQLGFNGNITEITNKKVSELNEDQKAFVEHFNNFVNRLDSKADNRNAYTLTKTEILARFIARFTEWTRNTATSGRYNFEQNSYKDNFNNVDYMEFVKLLQEKSYLDTTNQVEKAKTTINTMAKTQEQGYASFDDFKNDLKEKYGDKFDVLRLSKNESEDIIIDNIVVKEEFRKQGFAQKLLNDIINYADNSGNRILLTPTSEFGNSHKKMLTKWYKKNGFVDNKGKNTDLTTYETMIYNPMHKREAFYLNGDDSNNEIDNHLSKLNNVELKDSIAVRNVLESIAKTNGNLFLSLYEKIFNGNKTNGNTYLNELQNMFEDAYKENNENNRLGNLITDANAEFNNNSKMLDDYYDEESNTIKIGEKSFVEFPLDWGANEKITFKLIRNVFDKCPHFDVNDFFYIQVDEDVHLCQKIGEQQVKVLDEKYPSYKDAIIQLEERLNNERTKSNTNENSKNYANEGNGLANDISNSGDIRPKTTRLSGKNAGANQQDGNNNRTDGSENGLRNALENNNSLKQYLLNNSRTQLVIENDGGIYNVTIFNYGSKRNIMANEIFSKTELQKLIGSQNVAHVENGETEFDVYDIVPNADEYFNGLRRANDNYSISLDEDYKQAVKNNDLETAQKLVDEVADNELKESVIRHKNGKLKKVYHGTYSKFNTFKSGDIGYHFGSKSQAITRVGKTKNSNIISAYLNIKNPISFDVDLGSWDADYTLAKDLNKMGIIDDAELNNVLTLDGKNRNTKSSNEILKEVLYNKGYDGIVYQNYFESDGGKSYIAFYPNQIKSAEPITYDNNGNIISLSERFNESSNDIRYSISLDDDSNNDLNDDSLTKNLLNQNLTKRQEKAIEQKKQVLIENAPKWILNYDLIKTKITVEVIFV